MARMQTKEIKLVNGGVTLVDEQDYEQFASERWFRSPNGYARRQGWNEDGTHWQIFLHREINKTPPHLITDHINRNKLDNRRSNLRDATKGPNSANSKVREGRKYKGVSFHAASGLWRCRVSCDGKEYTSYHKSELDAAAHYGERAKTHFGEFSTANELPEGYVPVPHKPQKQASKFRGVGFSKQRGKWIACIYDAGKERQIGSFATEIEAATRYNSEALRIYGERAKLNPI